MTTQLSKRAQRTLRPLRWRRTLPNWITFPQKLRDAIPTIEPCAGRVLQLDSIDVIPNYATVNPSIVNWTGPRVGMKLRVCETGKLDGVFEVWVDLNPAAAEALAETLKNAAERAKQ